MNLTDQFLIAMPNLRDPIFGGSVTYVLEHSADGAMGLVVNRPAQMCLTQMLGQLDIQTDIHGLEETPIYQGGPCDNKRGLVLHDGGDAWEATLKIRDDLWVTSSATILCDIAKGCGPEHCLVALGYAGWSAGQLEEELSNNAWFHCPATNEILFHAEPAHKRALATRHLGIDYTQLTGPAGHA